MFVSTQGSYKLGHINNPFLYYLLLLYAYICVCLIVGGGGGERNSVSDSESQRREESDSVQIQPDFCESVGSETLTYVSASHCLTV